MARQVTRLADTRCEASSRTDPSQTAQGKATPAEAAKELYLLVFLEPLESAESPCLTGEKPLHLQPRLYRLQGRLEPLTHAEGSRLLPHLSSHLLKEITYLADNMLFCLLTLFEPLFSPGTVSALLWHYTIQSTLSTDFCDCHRRAIPC